MPTNEMNEKLRSKEWRDEHIKPVTVEFEDCDQVHNDEGY
jgi:hypothetical protein